MGVEWKGLERKGAGNGSNSSNEESRRGKERVAHFDVAVNGAFDGAL